MLYFRPHNRFGGGVYLVGGGTHPGSGLPVIFEGARITARLLLADLEERRSGSPRRPFWLRSGAAKEPELEAAARRGWEEPA